MCIHTNIDTDRYTFFFSRIIVRLEGLWSNIYYNVVGKSQHCGVSDATRHRDIIYWKLFYKNCEKNIVLYFFSFIVSYRENTEKKL